LNLTPPSEWAKGQRASIDLIQELNREHREARPGFAELEARIASYELAYRMQSAALDVGNLENEPADLKRSYGLEEKDRQTRSFGRKCLLARRLVERGVRFVQVYDMPDKDGWDAHEKLTNNHGPRARWTDGPCAALVADLKQRGLLDSTLVVWASEFGRTPMMQGEKGRQHNAAGFTIWMAGGGVKAGQRIGATDDVGLMAVDRPVPFRNLHATILQALGLQHEDLFFEHNSRMERLTGVAGSAKVIEGVLGCHSTVEPGLPYRHSAVTEGRRTGRRVGDKPQILPAEEISARFQSEEEKRCGSDGDLGNALRGRRAQNRGDNGSAL
jgi:hypothetical protein